jgi:hypothetical protein
MLAISSSTQRSVNERNLISYYRRKETLEESKKQNTEIDNNMKRNPPANKIFHSALQCQHHCLVILPKLVGKKRERKPSSSEKGKLTVPESCRIDPQTTQQGAMQLENKANTVSPTKHSLSLSLSLSTRLMATRENPRCIDISLGKALRALAWPWKP